MKYSLCLLFVLACCWGCTTKNDVEKHQNVRDDVFNAHEYLKEIEMEEVLIGAGAYPYIQNEYLIITDYKSTNELIHLFDKNSFAHVVSTGSFGQAPGEITIIGHVGTDESRRRFYITDHGKQIVYCYSLDSLLADADYLPSIKMRLSKELFPDRYHYVNDTLSIGVVIEPTSISTFNQFAAKWNMNTGDIKPLKYNHPDVEKKRIAVAVSAEYGIYVECNSQYDLMSIFSMNGDLKYNIYGPNWSSSGDKKRHYGKTLFYKDKILALYSGKDYQDNSNYPTIFHVFSLNGDYIKTVDVGCKIVEFCCDKDNDRLIFSFDDEMQFGYLPLEGLL